MTHDIDDRLIVGAAREETERRTVDLLVKAEARGLRRGLFILGAALIAGLVLGGWVILDITGRVAENAGINAAQAQADEANEAAVAEIRADAATIRAEIRAINTQREAEGLAPVPVPPAPTVDEAGTVDVDALADLVAVRVLADIRPALSPAQIQSLIAGEVETQVGQIPVPADGADGAPGDSGIGIALIEPLGCDLRITLTSGQDFTVGPLCGPPGPGLTPEQIAQAVGDYLTVNPLPTCPDGTTPETVTVLTDSGLVSAVLCTVD